MERWSVGQRVQVKKGSHEGKTGIIKDAPPGRSVVLVNITMPGTGEEIPFPLAFDKGELRRV